jgi:hypothetical protein
MNCELPCLHRDVGRAMIIQHVHNSIVEPEHAACHCEADSDRGATPPPATIADVLEWDRQRGQPQLDGGFTPKREAKVLARLA